MTGIAITNPGTGYSSAPTIKISSGENATAIPYLTPTSVGAINLLNSGGPTYTTAPAVTITAAGQAASIDTIYMRITTAAIATGGAGSQYTVGDILIVSGGSGSASGRLGSEEGSVPGRLSACESRKGPGDRMEQVPVQRPFASRHTLGSEGERETDQFRKNPCPGSFARGEIRDSVRFSGTCPMFCNCREVPASAGSPQQRPPMDSVRLCGDMGAVHVTCGIKDGCGTRISKFGSHFSVRRKGRLGKRPFAGAARQWMGCLMGSKHRLVDLVAERGSGAIGIPCA